MHPRQRASFDQFVPKQVACRSSDVAARQHVVSTIKKVIQRESKKTAEATPNETTRETSYFRRSNARAM